MSIFAHVGQPIHNLYDGLLHPFTGIDHLLAMVSVGVLAALSNSKRIAWFTPLAFVGGMVAGGAAGMAGFSVPAIDSFIAITVVALGVLLALRSTGNTSWLPLIALAFGALHGIAHGTEAPFALNPLAYIAGFVFATAALHAGGAIGGWSLRRTALARVATGTLVSGAGLLLLVVA